MPLVPLGEEESGWAFLAIGAAAALTAWWLLARMGRPEAKNAAPLLLFLGLVNGPMINSLREGNTTHIILLLLVLAFAALAVGLGLSWPASLLGICAVIKLPLLLFGAYYLLRGKWRVVLGGATSITTAVLLSLADYGLQGNIDWYRDSVEPFLGGVIPAFNVQSIDGFLIRLWTGEARLHDWDPMVPDTLHKVIRHILFLLVYGSAIWLGWRATRAEPMPAINGRLSARDTLEFVLVINHGHRHQPDLLDALLSPAAHSVGPLSGRPAARAGRPHDPLADVEQPAADLAAGRHSAAFAGPAQRGAGAHRRLGLVLRRPADAGGADARALETGTVGQSAVEPAGSHATS